MRYAWKAKLRRVILFAAILSLAGWGAQAPAQTEARRYLVLTVDVPFQFTVGQRTFNAGQYKFVVFGPGLLGMLNTKSRQAVHLITRDLQLAEAPANTHLVFKNEGKLHRLASILLGGRPQCLEILGEEISAGQHPPQVEPWIPLELYPRGKLPLKAP
jgi:hypothetical protein